MAQTPESRSLLAVALKSKSTELRQALESAELVAMDNWDDWWVPLTDQPLEEINPASISVHAQEGATRARAVLLLLHRCLPLAEALERAAHSMTPA